MKKKWKIICIVSGILAALLILGAGLLYISFNGSIVKKALITREVKAYVADQYPNEPYEVDFAAYDFKFVGYYCRVQSSASEDRHFLVWKQNGELVDDYETRVLKKENTLSRLSLEAENYVRELFSESYPYRTSLVLCERSQTDWEAVSEKLVLDQPFDHENFPFPVTLNVWVETQNDKPSWEELAERLHELREFVKDIIPFAEYFSMSIQEKYMEQQDGEYGPESYYSDVCVYDVPVDLVASEELEAFLEEEKERQEEESKAIARGEYDKK